MSEKSATSPYIVARGDGILIADDLNHPASDRICIAHYDLDALIEDVTALRDDLRVKGIQTSWPLI